MSSVMFTSCTEKPTLENNSDSEKVATASNLVDRFADIQVLRYDVEAFDKLSLDQKKLIYFLTEAGLSGRDILYDQNNAFNLEIRKTLENIVANYAGDDKDENYQKFMTYAKQVWFANGIHHHYGMDKIMPAFSQSYFEKLAKETKSNISTEALEAMFSTTKYMKRKVKDANVDMVVASANNFYGPGVTQKMVEDFYAARIDKNDHTPIEHGLNSTLILKDGKLYEDVWKQGGRYGKAIDNIIYWLEKAVTVAENDHQKEAFIKLIEYFKTGDLKTWDDYNILWAKSTKGDIDYILGFIEIYGDALGKRATFESVVQMTDFEASKQMKVLAENAQWFEDNSPLNPAHKKKNVKGVTYKVVQAVSESGDCSPATPIGINLPNNEWIREQHGSKSVSLGNIIDAYEKAGGSGMLQEFAYDQAEIDRGKAHGALAGKLHTALHEVIGHASGQINKGVGTTSETLKNFASTLEEARADLVGLYFIMDQKMIDIGLVPNFEVGKAEYDGYIRNGLMTQLQRLDLGKQVEEEHMQNRQLVAAWVFEKGAKDNVVQKFSKNGKTYYKINDYNKLRVLFGELLKEIQRIKSEGDYAAGKHLVETYGMKVDQKIHKEVLTRVKPLNIAPYSGFVNPIYSVVTNSKDEIIDVKMENKQTFVEQMLFYGNRYGFLKK